MCPPCEEQRRQHQHCRKAATDGTGHAEISMLAAVHTVKKCRRLGVGVGGFDGENTGLSTSLIPRPPGSTSGGSGRPACCYSGCGGPGCARSQPHLTRQMTAVSPNNVVRLAAIVVGLLAGLLAAPSLLLGARCPQGDCVETQAACARTAVSCTTVPACCRAGDSNRAAVSTERERAPVDASAALAAATIASPLLPQAAIDRTPYFPGAPHPLFLWVRALLI